LTPWVWPRLATAWFFAIAAESPTLAQPRIPHEMVPFAPGERGPQPAWLRIGERQKGGVLPDAIAYRGMRLPAPASTPSPRGEETLLWPFIPPTVTPSPSPLAPHPPLGARLPSLPGGLRPRERFRRFLPDTATAAHSTLSYAAVFQPSVVPFKRFEVQDSVSDDFSLRVADPRLRPLEVGGAALAGRDLFFGSVLALAFEGAPIPLPSVAPNSRILRFETTPPARVRFYRDGAENFWARVEASGLIRLSFLADAPALYFGGPIPSRPLGDVPAPVHPILPAPVRSVAQQVLAELGVTRTLPVDQVLSRLVGHFRSFRAGEIRPTRDPAARFWRLALGKVGACRHRAYAFVILTQALGLPARFVANEAHAFAEVWLPLQGWRRIDLGGVRSDLVVQGGAGKVRHRPRHFDPLPRPPPYRDAHSVPPGAGMAEPPPLPPSASGVPGLEGPAAPESFEPAPGPTLPRGKEPVRFVLEAVQRDVLRGEALLVEGRVETLTGVGAPGLRVDVYLSSTEAREQRRIGVLLTDLAGRFQARLPLSLELPTGRYRLHLETEGSARFGPARSDP
jgi:transglutaminase-like putative cysteine protease